MPVFVHTVTRNNHLPQTLKRYSYLIHKDIW